jgi:hypothetical protein
VCVSAHGYNDTGASRLLAKHMVLQMIQKKLLDLAKSAEKIFSLRSWFEKNQTN